MKQTYVNLKLYELWERDPVNIRMGKKAKVDPDTEKRQRKEINQRFKYPNLRTGGGVSRRDYRQRSTVKVNYLHSGFVNLHKSIRRKVNYLNREGVGKDGLRADFFNQNSEINSNDVKSKTKAWKDDRHYFEIIISPEKGYDLDLEVYTKAFVRKMSKRLNTNLEWYAVSHFNTGKPHTHLLIRGKREDGSDLVIPPKMIKRGLREIARNIATRALGNRTIEEIRKEKTNNLVASRFTVYDQWIIEEAKDGTYKLPPTSFLGIELPQWRLERRAQLYDRLEFLKNKKIISRKRNGEYLIPSDLKESLFKLGREGDIIRTMQAEMGKYFTDKVIIADRNEKRFTSFEGMVVSQGLEENKAERKFLQLINEKGESLYCHVNESWSKDINKFKKGSIINIRSREDDLLKPIDYSIIKYIEHQKDPAVVFNQSDFAHWADENLNLLKGVSGKDMSRAARKRLFFLAKKQLVEKKKNDNFLLPNDYKARLEALPKTFNNHIEVLSYSTLDKLQKVDGATYLDKILFEKGVEIDGLFGLSTFQIELRQALGDRILTLKKKNIQLQKEGERLFLKSEDYKKLLIEKKINLVKKASEKVPGDYKYYDGKHKISGKVVGILRNEYGAQYLIKGAKSSYVVPYREEYEKLKEGMEIKIDRSRLKLLRRADTLSKSREE